MKTIATAATVAAEPAPPGQDNTQESQNPSQSASPSGVRICWNNCSTTIHQMQQQQQDTMFGSARGIASVGRGDSGKTHAETIESEKAN